MKNNHWLIAIVLATFCAAMLVPSSTVLSTTASLVDASVTDCGKCKDKDKGDDEEEEEELALADCGKCKDKDKGDDEEEELC